MSQIPRQQWQIHVENRNHAQHASRRQFPSNCGVATASDLQARSRTTHWEMPATAPPLHFRSASPPPRESIDLTDLVSSPRPGRVSSPQQERELLEAKKIARLTKDPITPVELGEILHILDKAVASTPYAVCGKSAMTAWGYTAGSPYHVSVLVPVHCKHTVRTWAGADASVETFKSDPSLLGVQIPGDGQRLWKVRIKFLKSAEDFAGMTRVRLPLLLGNQGPGRYCDFAGGIHDAADGNTYPMVLGLDSLVDTCAAAYVDYRKRHPGRPARNRIGSDLKWLLGRIAARSIYERGAGPLNPEAVPHVLNREFWDVFDAAYPESRSLFVEAGLDTWLLPQPVSGPQHYGALAGATNPYRSDGGLMLTRSVSEVGSGPPSVESNDALRRDSTSTRASKSSCGIWGGHSNVPSRKASWTTISSVRSTRERMPSVRETGGPTTRR